MELLREGNDLSRVLNGGYTTIYSCQNSWTKHLRSVYYISILFKKNKTKQQESVVLCQNVCILMNNPRWDPRECEKMLYVRFLGRRNWLPPMCTNMSVLSEPLKRMLERRSWSQQPTEVMESTASVPADARDITKKGILE